MLRVAYIVPSLAPLGPVIVVRNLVERMVAHGHECVVFYFDERENPLRFACETRRISFWKLEDFSNFDWVHAHSFRPMVYASRLKGVRKMVTMHSYLFKEYRYSLGRVAGYLLGHYTMAVARKFDKVAVLSNDAKAYYSRWIPNDKLYVCYNGVDIEQHVSLDLQQQYEEDVLQIGIFKKTGTLVACVCEMVPIKNVSLVINALSRLPECYKLLLIGSGKGMHALMQQAKDMQVDDRVLFMGERLEAHRYQQLVDIFVMASNSEGFCLALVEAACYGKKIVCADIPGMKEKFTDKEVTYFHSEDMEELVKAILTANEHQEKGSKAKAVAEERFSTERMYEQYEAVYS